MDILLILSFHPRSDGPHSLGESQRRPAAGDQARRGGAMDASTQLAGVVRLLDSVLQNSSRGHREVEKKLANSPRVFLWPEKVRGKEATRGGGSFLRDPNLAAVAARA